MRRISYLLRTGSAGINVKLILQPSFFNHVSKNALTHGRSANISMTAEHYIYHFSSPFLISCFILIHSHKLFNGITLLNLFLLYNK